ncbi:MAG: hypothetical protein OEX18_00180 [Candidatus Krumholzibacteria bacterium]|nr:hypothetical protein [Candidatus Krumholzibacteria bacterium]MDH4335678.1 hypothetical protein [Candidatus Krumholzibacteria bacterium]MDH5270023.1 hypothetical protein [Candidatus Krumholzibacteria bacterium]MDH5627342.1 hypothetical protein [Candidatus Krumholzibacteria bacterium]
MSDELTPEERKALDSLPRERIPAGLEERVVGAMREHGFLEKRRPAIVLTQTRIAGLLAACVALVIGAYSVGLHRGGDGQAPPAFERVKPDEPGRLNQPAATLPEEEAAEPVATAKTLVADQPAKEQPRQAAPSKDEAREDEQKLAEGSLESKQKRSRAAQPAAPAQSEADRAARNAALEKGLASRDNELDDVLESAETPAATAVLQEQAAPAPDAREAAGKKNSTPTFTFVLNGVAVTVETPDSVRVVQDAQGRMLLIYTSDGIIRIRVADED